MKFSKTILSTLLLTSTATFADPYNAEVGLAYVNDGAAIGRTVLPADNVSSIQLHGTYNFSAVDTTNKPLGEADFLGKHSYIDASYASIDPDGGNSLDAQHIGVGFYIPNSMFYVGAQYIEFEDFNDTQVSIGITPIDGLLITTSHNEEADDYNANIFAKYVTKLSGDTAINLEAGYAKGEDAEDEFEDDAEDTLYLAADYYFTNRFSVGASFTDEEDSTYSIRSRYFHSANLSFNAELVSDKETDSDALILGAAVRF